MNDKELYKQTVADLYKKCDELRDRLIDVEKQLANYQWISVKDRLPIGKINPTTQDFELVICATTFGDVRAYGYGKAKGHDKAHFWHGAGIMDEYVTHWMPLPNMPEQPYEEWDRIAKEREE